MSHYDSLVDALTPAELRVLEQASYGGSNKQISNVLFCSVTTVKFHMAAVFGKLCVGSRTELIALYWQTVLRDVEADREDALDALAAAGRR